MSDICEHGRSLPRLGARVPPIGGGAEVSRAVVRPAKMRAIRAEERVLTACAPFSGALALAAFRRDPTQQVVQERRAIDLANRPVLRPTAIEPTVQLVQFPV